MDTLPNTQGQATVRDLVAVVFRQKWVILTIFAVTTVSVFLLNLRTPPTFESSARVRVERGRKETALTRNMRVLTWKEEISSEIETVKSYPVARLAQEFLDARHQEGQLQNPVKLNRAGISAGVIGESSVIEISYTSQDASVCRPITDAVTAAYTEFRREALSFPQASTFFEERITQANRELMDLEQTKEMQLADIGMGGSTYREDDVGGNLQFIERELLKVEARRSLLERQLGTARELEQADEIDAAYFTELKLENAWVLNQLRDKVIRNRLTRDELRATLTPQHPKLKGAEEALASAEAMLRREVQSTTALMEQQLSEARGQEVQLAGQAARLRDELTRLPKYKVELGVIDHEIAVKRNEIKELKSTQVLTDVNRATSPDFTLTLLAPAGAPYAKKTRDYVRMALAPLMSLVVGLLLAFFLDSLDHSLRTRAEVEEHLGLPVLATFPDSRS